MRLEGAVPLIEKSASHVDFIQKVRPQAVLLKINHARRFAQLENQTATDVFGPNTTVITTTTITDSKLKYLRATEERDILQAFQPDYHIPADYPTYHEQSPTERRENLDSVRRGTIWLDLQLTEHATSFPDQPPQLIPLIKGVTPDEWQSSATIVEGLNAPLAAFYATQYFDGGIRITELVEDLHTIASLLPDDTGLLVIGSLAPTYLDRFPDAVLAVSGLAWNRATPPTTTTPPAELRSTYREFATTVNTTLGVDPPLTVHPDDAHTDPTTPHTDQGIDITTGVPESVFDPPVTNRVEDA